MTHLEDCRIIELFFERSEQAVRELDRKYGKAVKILAQNILHDGQDAEECVNDAYLGVWSSIPPQRPDSLGTYVCRIARNQAVSRLRARSAAKRSGGFDLVLDELEECIPSGADVEAEAGWIVRICGEAGMDTLVKVAKNLEIRESGAVLTYSVFENHYTFMDGGVG